MCGRSTTIKLTLFQVTEGRVVVIEMLSHLSHYIHHRCDLCSVNYLVKKSFNTMKPILHVHGKNISKRVATEFSITMREIIGEIKNKFYLAALIKKRSLLIREVMDFKNHNN